MCEQDCATVGSDGQRKAEEILFARPGQEKEINDRYKSEEGIWGKSEILKRFIDNGTIGQIIPVPFCTKGMPITHKIPMHIREHNFWARMSISKESCWEWAGKFNHGGYGVIRWPSTGDQVAHRTSFLLTRGIAAGSLQVCHHCDNRKCIRPDHLFLGNHKINHLDKLIKGRQYRPVGERNPHATLTDEKVIKIKELIRSKSGLFDREIAAIVGCSRGQVSLVKFNRSWNHIP